MFWAKPANSQGAALGGEWLFIHALSVIVERGCSLYIKSVRSKESSQRNTVCLGFFFCKLTLVYLIKLNFAFI